MALLLMIYMIFSTTVGTWVSGIPTKMEFEKGMENEITRPKKKRVYKIVSVIQPPFMQWNETLSKYFRFTAPSPKFQSYSHCSPTLGLSSFSSLYFWLISQALA